MKNGKYELVVPPVDYPGKLYRGRYAYEHHVVFWQTTGRLRGSGCVIHHKNDQKRENSPDNLEEMRRSDHTALHGTTVRTLVQLICDHCQCQFSRAKNRIKKDQNRFFCCRSHQVIVQQKERRDKSLVIGK